MQRPGSLLLEAVLSIAVFSLFLTGVGLTLFLGQQSTVAGADRVRAVFQAEQALEGVRQLRDEDFLALSPGTYGITVGTNGRWALQSQPITSSGFTTTLTISSHSVDWLQARSKVEWNFGKSRSGSIVLSTYLTNWHKVVQSGNWNTIRFIKTYTGGTTAQFTDVLVQGNYAYVTGDRSQNGRGLYIFDISNPASPQRIASSFDLLAGAYDATIQGNMLILATDNSAAEIQAYDITHPATLNAARMSGSYNLPGSGLARSINSFNGTIYAGTNQNTSGNEFFALNLFSTGGLSLAGSLSVDANVTDISLRDGYAYLSTADDTAEFQVVDVFDPTALAYIPGKGVDLTEVFDGTITHTFGTSAIIGRANGSTISELMLYSVADSPFPSSPPGPWSVELGGAATGFDSDPTGKYGFVSSDFSTGELRTISMSQFANGANPILATYNAPSAIRGIAYDWVHDRLFAVSATTFSVFAPAL